MTSKQHPGGSVVSLDSLLDTDSEGGDADDIYNTGRHVMKTEFVKHLQVHNFLQAGIHADGEAAKAQLLLLFSILSSSVEWLETSNLCSKTSTICNAHADAEFILEEGNAPPELRDASTQWYPPCSVARTHPFRQQHAWMPPGLHVVPPPGQRKQSPLHQRQVAC